MAFPGVLVSRPVTVPLGPPDTRHVSPGSWSSCELSDESSTLSPRCLESSEMTNAPRMPDPELTAASCSHGHDTHAKERASDIQQALQTPTPAVVATIHYLTVLVAGAPGLGKTTFIKNLHDITNPESAEYLAPAQQERTNPTLDSFRKEPETSCTSITLREGSCSYCYRFQDTPGLASRQAHKAICKHVAAQDQAYLRHIQDPRKHCFKTDNIDPRVDVCLIFLNPHAVSAQEVKLMQGMGKLCVPVIPLIAKADFFSRDEMVNYKTGVMKLIQQAMAQARKPIVWTVDPCSTAAVGKEMPFAVITGTATDCAVHRNWLIRESAYGSCEVLSSGVSDNLALKALLFNLEFHRLKQHTVERSFGVRCEPKDHKVRYCYIEQSPNTTGEKTAWERFKDALQEPSQY